MDTLLYYIGQLFALKQIKVGLSTVMLGFSWLLGGLDKPIEALAVLFVFDFILGWAYAFSKGKIDYNKLKGGIYKFILFCMAISAGNMVDYSAGILGGPLEFHAIITFYLIANEALSALKHISNFGVKLPTVVIQKLEEYKHSMEIPRSGSDRRKDPLTNKSNESSSTL